MIYEWAYASYIAYIHKLPTFRKIRNQSFIRNFTFGSKVKSCVTLILTDHFLLYKCVNVVLNYYLFLLLFQAYGMTEASAVGTLTPGQMYTHLHTPLFTGSVGILAPYTTAKVYRLSTTCHSPIVLTNKHILTSRTLPLSV